MLMNLKELGARCKQYRESIGLYQYHVADETGYSTENISAFETGRNDNSRILLWYFMHGMKVENLKGELEHGKKL